jgi:NTP pyrophosphatase (non-canonical NTP hydrolase)
MPVSLDSMNKIIRKLNMLPFDNDLGERNAAKYEEPVEKILRDKNGVISLSDREEVAKELGDVLWYVAMISEYLELPLSEVAKMNLDKLESRYVRNKIHGAGDNR